MELDEDDDVVLNRDRKVIQLYSDMELRAKLVDLGMKPGLITRTTRTVYDNVLLELMHPVVRTSGSMFHKL